MPAYRSIRERLLGECDVDGFQSVAPDLASYCPREGRKVLASDHARCESFGGYLYTTTGEEAGVRCMYSVGRCHP